jgi:hypothetical protein
MGPRVRIRFPPGASQKIYHPLGCPSSDAASEYLIRLRTSSTPLERIAARRRGHRIAAFVERVPSGAARRYLLPWSETVASAWSGMSLEISRARAQSG